MSTRNCEEKTGVSCRALERLIYHLVLVQDSGPYLVTNRKGLILYEQIRMLLCTSQNFSFKHHFFGVLDGLRESWSFEKNLVNMP